MRYRKKPVEVEAFKLGIDYIPDWFMDSVTANEVILHGEYDSTNADIHTLEGWHHANYGDYIIQGIKGEIYPCKPDIFLATYEAVPVYDVGDFRTPSPEATARLREFISNGGHMGNHRMFIGKGGRTMKKIIPALPCLVWGAVGIILDMRGAAMPEGLFYGGLLIAVMLGVMLVVLCHD